MKFSKGTKKVVKGFKLRWTNGYGDDLGNKYPYIYRLEKDGVKVCDIPNDLMDEFFKNNNGWQVGTNMFRGGLKREATAKLVKFLKERNVLNADFI